MYTLTNIPAGELRIRLARWGARRNPFYGIVVGPKGVKRDGKHYERLGTYNPIPEADQAEKADYLLKVGPRKNTNISPPAPKVKHIQLNTERVKFWIAAGAEPSDRAAWILSKAGLIPELPHRLHKTGHLSLQDEKTWNVKITNSKGELVGLVTADEARKQFQKQLGMIPKELKMPDEIVPEERLVLDKQMEFKQPKQPFTEQERLAIVKNLLNL